MAEHTKKHYLKDIWSITKKTFTAWGVADPFRQSSIIAYYALFSIPALLVIVITSAGFVFGKAAIEGEISRQIGEAIGQDTAKEVEDMIAQASARKSSVLATVISVITLLVGSTAVFAQLQVSLNQIWEVRAETKKMWLKTLKDRLFSFGLILSIGFLALVSLVVTTGLAALGTWIKAHLPDFMLVVFELLNFTISFAVITVLFALLFKVLPDAKIKWRDVWIGAMVTSFLFSLGKLGLGYYFGKAQPASTYGAAGSVVLLMLWASYSCMILFLGAEFTKQFAVFYGRLIEPTREAVRIHQNEEEKLVSDKKEAVKSA